jgi:hypothetical protein
MYVVVPASPNEAFERNVQAFVAVEEAKGAAVEEAIIVEAVEVAGNSMVIGSVLHAVPKVIVNMIALAAGAFLVFITKNPV